MQPAPDIAAWLSDYNRKLAMLEAQAVELSPQTARDGLARLTASMVDVQVAIDCVRDTVWMSAHKTSIPLRVYHPQPQTALPVLIYFHGGGHMAGSIDVYDPICRQIAEASQHIVIAVDYRLSPEHPYPAGLQDGADVIRHHATILRNLNLEFKASLSIGGDSAGGAMSATLAQQFSKADGVTIERQILIYPSLDYTMQQTSVSENGRGYFLHAERMQWLFDAYFQHAEDRLAASPLFMHPREALPKTLLITAQFCPLRDEGLAYVDALRRACVEVHHRHFDDMIHAYLNMQKIAESACAQTYQLIGDFLNNTL